MVAEKLGEAGFEGGLVLSFSNLTAYLAHCTKISLHQDRDEA